MEVILTVDHLRKHFSSEAVLVDVSFQLRAGDKVGLVGPNGCGKTTLLNILAGREESEKGSIEKSSGTSIGYLEQRPEVEIDRTVIEEARLALAPLIEMQHEAERIAAAMSESKDDVELMRLSSQYDRIHESLQRHDAYHLDHRVARILHGVGFLDDDFDKPAAALSGGELNRLNLAKLLLEEPDIMLLDEPSNHLDLPATEWLEEFLQATSAAVILVSHDRYFLDRVTNRTLELYRGTIDDYPGNFTKYTLLKEERLAVQTRTYEKYVEDVEKAKEFIRRNHYGMKAPQAEDRRKKLERMLETPAEAPRKIDTPAMHFPKPSRTGDIVFRFENLSKGFAGDDGVVKLLFRELTFNIERGERWGVLGPNGCGKTTLLKCLVNLLVPDTGKIIYGAGLKVGYFDQQLRALDDEMRVVDAIRPDKKIFEEPARRNLLGAFGLTGDQQLQSVASLSGGQRCRAALAKLSADDANVLILDEPTNHLDIWARSGLERAICEFEGTVLFISHDRYFVDRVADHLLIIQPDGKFKTLEGNYSTFKQMVAGGFLTDPFNNNWTNEKKDNINNIDKTNLNNQKIINAKLQNTKNNAKNNAKNENNLTDKKIAQEAWKENAKRKEAEKKKFNQNQFSQQNKKYNNHTKNKENLHNTGSWKNIQDKVNSPLTDFNNNGDNNGDVKKTKRIRKFPFRKVADIEEEIFARETRVMALNDDLLSQEVVRDGERLKAIHLEIKQEQEKIATLYEHWDESNELNW
ncbi:MAG: ABC-F family ATP-binding cassette domain-containing protein [Planctomycetaceae bacterium]|jgi:ATP-binding cassette subfamily F protein 3|nr:ABC-F family ATP-binding cassette domain-containing protein [Planctomycetaceae bacterium]